jgi:hypothetical protein
MRRTPADLARVKARFPQWYIQRTRPGEAVPGYTAVEIPAGRRIWCPCLAELESRLQEREDKPQSMRLRGSWWVKGVSSFLRP